MRRLDQLLSNLGYCSRHEARAWLKAGRVTANGKPLADPGLRSDPASVRVDGEPLDHPEGLLLLLNKPAGVVCSMDPREGARVYDLFPARWQRRNPALATVGRLDRDTTGVLLVTDQPTLVHRLTSPRSEIQKVYSATLDRDVPPAEQERMIADFASGRLMLAGESSPCLSASLSWTSPRDGIVTVVEGRYHQVKRMFAAYDLNVVHLHRERFGPYVLGSLQPGEWQELSG